MYVDQIDGTEHTGDIAVKQAKRPNSPQDSLQFTETLCTTYSTCALYIADLGPVSIYSIDFIFNRGEDGG